MNPLAADDPSAQAARREHLHSPAKAPHTIATREARGTGRICVVLPAYNEERNLERLLERIRETLDPLDYSYEVVVVNDGSQDRTGEVAQRMSESMPIQLETHRKNK